MKNYLAIITLSCLLLACSDSSEQVNNSVSEDNFPPLPTNSSERVKLNGKMSFWMYEGEAGCYGTIVKGSQEVQLWIDSDGCGEREYAENENASVEVTFRSDNQYGPDKIYTITRFQ